jgi:hypothetical protein
MKDDRNQNEGSQKGVIAFPLLVAVLWFVARVIFHLPSIVHIPIFIISAFLSYCIDRLLTKMNS